MKSYNKVIIYLLILVICISQIGCGKEPEETNTKPTQKPSEGDGVMYVPQLSTTWYKAKKIVGINNQEFISDFLLIQDTSKRWHCIGIGGQDHVQDSFFHAVGDDLLKPFEYTDRVYSNGDKNLENTNWMWAPYAIYTENKEKAYMYYHHQTKDSKSEMRMLESTDAKLDHWVPTKFNDLNEGCIAFEGFSCRDACIFYDEDLGKYVMYYAATGICMRTSSDLIHWSDYKVVMNVPEGFQAAESPFVIKRFGYYYLFVSGFDYGRIAVYRSKSYDNFGHPVKDLLGELNGHAPEIVTVDGVDYIACAAINATDGIETYPGGSPAQHNIVGVYIQELKWVDEKEAKWLKLPEKVKKELHIVKAEADYHWSFDGSIKEEKTQTGYIGDIPEKSFTDDSVIGKAILLDGAQNYTMPEFNFSLGQNFTISFYINMQQTNGNYNVLFSKGNKDDGHIELYVAPNGNISFYQQELGIHDTTANVCDSNWHHVAFTYDSSVLKGYVDGEEIYSTNIKATVKNDNELITIGSFVQGEVSHYQFNGAIDELKVFNRVLTNEELGVK